MVYSEFNVFAAAEARMAQVGLRIFPRTDSFPGKFCELKKLEIEKTKPTISFKSCCV